jgi:hypothetical protein
VILENYQSFQYIFNVIGDNGSIIFIAEYDKVLNSLMEKINKVIDSLKEKEYLFKIINIIPKGINVKLCLRRCK